MANITVQILGQGYGETPAQITGTANGNVVFSGTIHTINQSPPMLPENSAAVDPAVLFTFDIDYEGTGEIPMTCTVSEGTVIFGAIIITGATGPDALYTTEQVAILKNPATTLAERVAIYTAVANPPLSQQEIDTLLDPTTTPEQTEAILVAHNVYPPGEEPIVYPDLRSSVTINGIAQNPDRIGLPGTWWWTIDAGSTLAYNLIVV
jgi:hypothetical protein